MAVPDRNQVLFGHVFQVHHQVWHSVVLSFYGSYTLHRRIRYSCICIASMSLAPSGSSVSQNWWHTQNMQQNSIWFLSGSATWKYCGVVSILFAWFLRVSSLHAHVFIQFCNAHSTLVYVCVLRCEYSLLALVSKLPYYPLCLCMFGSTKNCCEACCEDLASSYNRKSLNRTCWDQRVFR